MRRRSATTSVSLFPFLAVLLCAMGALILLLVVLTTQIREDVIKAAIALKSPPANVISAPVTVPPKIERVVVTIPAPPPAPPPLDPNVALRSQLQALEAERVLAEQELETLRAAAAQSQTALAAARQRLDAKRLDLQASQARIAARTNEIRQRETKKEELLEAIQIAQGSLKSALQAADAAEPKVVIVPYDGRLGTARRPILVECTADAIRFLPEDVALSAGDLEGFLPDFNPLLSGAVVLRRYWSEVDGSEAPKPYVLLLVHEDGVAAYYAARSLLRSLGGETGYELVTEDLKLAFPPVDAEAASLCREAVRETLNKRAALIAELARNRVNREPMFPTGRFEIDPRDHDPTRGPDSFWGRRGDPTDEPSGGNSFERSGGREPSLAASRRATGTSPTPPAMPPGELSSASSPGPRRLPPAPLASASNAASAASAGSLARQASETFRERQRERDALQSAADDQLLQQALGESLPQFGAAPGGKRQWGTSSSTANISLERPVEVEVTDRSIRVGDQPPIEFGANGPDDAAIRQVLDAIGREARAWGHAPGEFYWSPRLRVAIRPGAMLPFDRMKSALRNAGLGVSSRITLEPTAPAFVELSHAAKTP
jgi:hypothetical protein